jgi:hypothetical protein
MSGRSGQARLGFARAKQRDVMNGATTIFSSSPLQLTMPKLRISASSSPSSPSQVLSPNASTPTRVSSDLFEGDILVRIKDYNGESGDGVKRPEPEGHEYFIGDRDGKTWSILVRGRWKEEVDGQYIMSQVLFATTLR